MPYLALYRKGRIPQEHAFEASSGLNQPRNTGLGPYKG